MQHTNSHDRVQETNIHLFRPPYAIDPPFEISDDPQFLLRDPSAAHRIYSLHIGLLSMLEAPLGVGGDMFYNQAKNFHRKYGVEKIIHRY